MPGATPVPSPSDKPPLRAGRPLRLRAVRAALIYALFGAAWLTLADLVRTRFIPAPQVPAFENAVKGWAFVAVSAVIVLALVLRELAAHRRAGETDRAADERMPHAAHRVSEIVRSIPLAIMVLDRDGRVALWNPAAERTFGWAAEEAIGRPPLFIPAEVWSEYDAYVRRVFAGDVLAGEEVELRRKDGEPVRLRLWTAPLRDEGGLVAATYAMFEDITRRRETESFLQRRDAMLAAVGRVAQDLLLPGDPLPRLPDVLQRLGEALDTSRAYVFQAHAGPLGEAVISQRGEWCAAGIVPQIDNPELQNIPRHNSPFTAWGDALEQGEVVRGHAWQFSEAGPVFMTPEDIHSILLLPIFADRTWWGVIGFDECRREREWAPAEIEAARAAAGMLGAVMARESAARALEDSEARYRRLVDNAPEAIFRFRLYPDRAFEYVSPAVTALAGYSPEELYADADLILEVVHPEDRPRLLRILDGSVSAAGSLQLRWQHRDGRVVWVEQMTSPVADEEGRLLALEGIARDVTRRVEAEMAQRRRAEQLAGLHQTSLDISAQTALEPLLQAIVERAVRLVGTEMGGLFLTSPDGQVLEQAVEVGREEGRFTKARLRLGEGVSGIAAARGEPFIVDNYRAWPGKAEAFRDSTTGRVLAVPLKTQDKTLGVLYLSDEAAGAFDEDEIRLATLFAEQAAIAIGNARMYDETRRFSQQMEALYQTALEISSQTDLDLLLADVVNRAASLLGLPVGGLYLLDEATQTLEMVVSRYPDRDYAGTKIAVGEGVAGRAVALNGPYFVESYADWEGKAQVYDDVRLGRVLAVPLRVAGRITGAVFVSDFQRGVFNPAEIRLVALFADQAAVAIENSRLLASERQHSSQIQRSRALIESLSRVAANVERSTEPSDLLRVLEIELRDLGIHAWMGVLGPERGGLETRMLTPDASGVDGVLAEIESVLGTAPSGEQLEEWIGRVVLGDRPGLLPATDLARHLMPGPLPDQILERLLVAANAGPGTQAVLLPVIQLNSPAGLLVLWSDQLQEEDVSALSIFGAQVSTALEKAHLLADARRRAAYLEALSATAAALRVAPDLASMQPIILGQLQRLLDAQGATLTLRESAGGDNVTVFASGAWESVAGLRLPAGTGIVGRVIGSGVPKISADIRTDADLARPDLVRDVPAIACVPLTVQKETIGCLMVGRQVPFRDEDVRLLTAIGEMAGAALHRAGIMETLEARVAQRTRELEQANTQLQELDRLKTEFVSNVTHELRTPITNILLYLDLLRLSPSADKSAHYMGVLKSESVRLGRLIEDLLMLSRLERGMIGLELEPHPLDALLAEVLVAQLPTAMARAVQVTHEPNLNLPVALVSRTQILQVFTNLVANAIAYTHSEGHVRVSTAGRSVDGRPFVGASVFNDGPPIESDDLPHIFERFYRGRTGKQSGQPGTGLGLAISREIVQQHGGWIEVESGDDGTTFSVWVPAAAG
ncbi:MAG: GAF domain-containing protein [Chloroflexi bacterium]|nr:GAF domain-containing protein [Chloroflexota bacterium]